MNATTYYIIKRYTDIILYQKCMLQAGRNYSRHSGRRLQVRMEEQSLSTRQVGPEMRLKELVVFQGE